MPVRLVCCVELRGVISGALAIALFALFLFPRRTRTGKSSLEGTVAVACCVLLLLDICYKAQVLYFAVSWHIAQCAQFLIRA